MNAAGKGPSKKRTVCTRKQPESRAGTRSNQVGEGKGAPGEAASHGPQETDMTDNKGLYPDESYTAGL